MPFSPEHFWWFGQNRRTCQIGSFARTVVSPLRKMRGGYGGSCDDDDDVDDSSSDDVTT